MSSVLPLKRFGVSLKLFLIWKHLFRCGNPFLQSPLSGGGQWHWIHLQFTPTQEAKPNPWAASPRRELHHFCLWHSLGQMGGVTQTVLFSAPCKVIAPWSHSSYIPSTPTQQPGLAQILSLTLLASPCVLPLARDKAKALPLLCSKAGKPIFHYFARSRKEKAN